MEYETLETRGNICSVISLTASMSVLYSHRKTFCEANCKAFKTIYKETLYKDIIEPIVNKIRGNKKTLDKSLDKK